MAFVYRSKRSTGLARSITPAIVGPGAYDVELPKVFSPSPAPFTTTAERSCTATPVQSDEKPIQFAPIDRPMSCGLPATVSFTSNVERFVTPQNDTPPPASYNIERFQKLNKLTRDYTRQKPARRAQTANRTSDAVRKRLSPPSIPTKYISGYVEDPNGKLAPIESKVETTPSPVSYDPKYELTRPDIFAAAVDFNRDVRERPMNQARENTHIGPGYYHLQSARLFAESEPAIRSSFVSTTHRMPLISATAAVVPGVGTYTISGCFEKPTSQPTHFGSTAERLAATKVNDTPAPGQYNTAGTLLQQRRAGSVFVSRSERFHADRSAETPAVGQYYEHADWIKEYRRTHFSRNQTLGGVAQERFDYNNQKMLKTKRHQMKSDHVVSNRRTVITRQTASPGLAAFTSKTCRFPRQKDVSQFVSDEEVKKNDRASSEDAQYYSSSHPTSSFSSYRHQLAEERSKTPGPGAYNSTSAAAARRYSHSSQRGIQWAFGIKDRNVFNIKYVTPKTPNNALINNNNNNTTNDVHILPSTLIKKSFNVTFQ